MRTSIILTAVLAGGALANPVRKLLEERALVVDIVTTTTVVWVTEGGPTPVAQANKAVADTSNQMAAVNPAYQPHRHAHGHPQPKAAQPPAVQQQAAQPAAAQPVTTSSPPPPPPVTTSAPPVQQPTTTTAPAAPAASPNTGSNSGSSNAPTSYPSDLDSGSAVYKALVLQHHNIHRANHSANDLEWDDTLAGYAAETAKTCVWGHSLAPGGGGYGQNIAAGISAGEIAKTLTNGFYNDEMMLYPTYGSDSPDMGNFEKWGHFSQMLWQSTTKVGCYTYTCSPAGAPPLDCRPGTTESYLKNTGCGNGGMNAIFTVCNYSPPGNYAGEYSKVGAPGKKGMVVAGPNGVTGL
ncbi:MAG: hypothetical protein Q9218_006245 [Villophora microphyllina]